MICRCDLLKKKQDQSTEEFNNYWKDVHAPIEATTPNIKSYKQHLIIDREQRHMIARGPVEIDGYSEIAFDSISDMVQGITSLDDHLSKFTSDTKTLVLVKKFDTPVPEALQGKKLIKRMSFLGRGEGISAERFQHEWWGLHSDLVRDMPGYVGYAQNLVIDRIIDGKHVSYDELPIEGVVEFWFEDMDGFNECYDSQAFAKCAAHGATFLGSVTTYMCETTEFPIATTK